MGLKSFFLGYGKPDEFKLASQWYWFEFFYWLDRFYDRGAFTLSMTDEDIEMTDRLNRGLAKRYPKEFGGLPERARFVRSKEVPNHPSAMEVPPIYAPCFTANPDDPRIYVPLMIHFKADVETQDRILTRIGNEMGPRVSSPDLLGSHFKAGKTAFLFDDALVRYYRLQSESFGRDDLSFKARGRREEIRRGLFGYLATTDVNIALNRLGKGETGTVIDWTTYSMLESDLLEGRQQRG